MRLRGINLPLTLVVLMWAFNFVALKLMYRDMAPPAVSLIRYLVMIALLVVVCLARKEVLRYERGDFWRLNLVGFLSLGLYMVLFMEGMSLTTPGEGAVMLATSPVLTYLLAVAIKMERFVPRALIGTLIAFIGVGLVVMGPSNGHGSLLGNVLCLLSAGVWAISAVMMRPFLGRYTPLSALTLSAGGALPVMLIYGGVATAHVSLQRVTPIGWAAFLHIAILSGAVAFTMYYEGIRQVGPGAATIYQFFIPPVAAIFAWVVLGQPLGWVQVAGLGVVLLGVAAATWARMERSAPLILPEREGAGVP